MTADQEILDLIGESEQTERTIDKLQTESENLSGILGDLGPWASLETPIEELTRLEKATCLSGLIPDQYFEQVTEQIGDLNAAVQQVGTANNKHACLIVCLTENAAEVQKLLRSADFEAVSFGSMTGTIAEQIKQHAQKLNVTEDQLKSHRQIARSLAKNLLKLQILDDHHSNLLDREQARSSAPATEQTVILEGWVKRHDFPRLQETVAKFGASSLSTIDPAEGEAPPVEIENRPSWHHSSRCSSACASPMPATGLSSSLSRSTS
jgi:V/A-type H+-transporting ATPase subunit I